MAAVSSIAAGALVASAVAGVASAGYSMYQGRQQQKAAEKEQKLQQAEVQKNQAEAKKKEKGLIENQRYQLGLDSNYTTSGTSPGGMTVGKDATLG